MSDEVQKLANKMGGYRSESAHLNIPSFPGWDWLPFVRKGWKWDFHVRGRLQPYFQSAGDPTPILLRPGDTYNFPRLDPDQPQWLINIIILANTPWVKLDFILDTWKFNVSAYDISLVGANPISNWMIKALPPRLMTPYGPIYALLLDPVQPVSITSEVQLEVGLSTGTPLINSEVLAFGVGRVIINDYNIFLDEVRKTSVELAVGQNIKQWSDAQSPDNKLIADIGPSGRRTL